jgi:ribonuclease HII
MSRAWEALVFAFPGYTPPAVSDTELIVSDTVVAMKPAFTLYGIVDGLYCPELPMPCRAMVKADAKVPEVMAASILAKTARDRMMLRYSLFYPEYGYEKHKGYPTKAHLKALGVWGPSPIQRVSFIVKSFQSELF